MAHKQQKDFIERTKQKFPKTFINKKVLNIGSFIINGSEIEYFTDCEIIGLDIGPGLGVDIVCSAHEYNEADETFDTIISCECWEHNPFYKESILNAIRMLKSGGAFIFTCATTGRPVHGTFSQDKIDQSKGQTLQGNTFDKWISMPNVSREDWDNEYYRNVTEKDVRSFLDLDDVFSEYCFEVNDEHHDLYFYGIKK
jgi:SAM-dependent methyltransferase